MRANSSSTSEVPMPIITPRISAQGTTEPVPTAMNAPDDEQQARHGVMDVHTGVGHVVLERAPAGTGSSV